MKSMTWGLGTDVKSIELTGLSDLVKKQQIPLE